MTDTSASRPCDHCRMEERYCEIAAKRLSQEMLPLADPDPVAVQAVLIGGAE